MQRPYQTTPQQQVKFFVGREVEHSPLKGHRTLFVVGVQPLEEILSQAQQHKVTAIYLGANQSFDANPSEAWHNLLSRVLQHNRYWVTLDFDVQHAEWVAEGGYCESNRFVPMISVKIPYVSLFNYNTTIKIDDRGFEASNPGVWCHRLVELMQPNKFTDWTLYREDRVTHSSHCDDQSNP